MNNNKQSLNETIQFKTSYNPLVNYLDTNQLKIPDFLRRKYSIEILEFPTRLENALLTHGKIYTVGDFFDISIEKLKKIRNIGEKSFRYLETAKRIVSVRLVDATDKPELTEDRPEHTKTEPVITKELLVGTLLDKSGSEKSREIIVLRFGLRNGDRMTLEEIGHIYGVTRERIRQLQDKAIKKMQHPSNTARKPIISILEKILYENGGIIDDETADQKLPKILGQSCEDGSSLMDLCAEMGWIDSCKVKDFKIYSPNFRTVSLCKLTDDIRRYVIQHKLGVDTQLINSCVESLKKINDDRFSSMKFINSYCKIDPRIEEDNLVSIVSGNKVENLNLTFRSLTYHISTQIWHELIKKVLESEQSPLHFTEITDRINDMTTPLGKSLDVRRVHSLLIEGKIFAHTGIRGTYGLTEWGLRKESTLELICECLKNAGFPLHWKQIYNYVSKYKDSKPGSIISILKTQGIFTEVYKGVFGFK